MKKQKEKQVTSKYPDLTLSLFFQFKCYYSFFFIKDVHHI